MSVLPDHEIRELAQKGTISPYYAEQFQPSSYDVRLGRVFRVITRHRTRYVDLGGSASDD